jgi:hypothetical protein
MKTPDIYNFKKGPERKIQDDLIKFLRLRQWYVLETHGNMFQRGLPDLFATHIKHGPRWIEVKYAERYCFTPAQLDTFPQLTKHGSGVWILTAATEHEYRKLFQGPNWAYYLYMLNTRGVKSLHC